MTVVDCQAKPAVPSPSSPRCAQSGVPSTGKYSAWLNKTKGDQAKAKWWSGSTKRYFTLDFDMQLFYYSHSESQKRISPPVHFREILSAERLPPPVRFVKKKNAGQSHSGFLVRTTEREFELHTISDKTGSLWDASQWVHALNAAKERADTGAKKIPLDYMVSASMSLETTATNVPSSGDVSATSDVSNGDSHDAEPPTTAAPPPSSAQIEPPTPTASLAAELPVEAPPAQPIFPSAELPVEAPQAPSAPPFAEEEAPADPTRSKSPVEASPPGDELVGDSGTVGTNPAADDALLPDAVMSDREACDLEPALDQTARSAEPAGSEPQAEADNVEPLSAESPSALEADRGNVSEQVDVSNQTVAPIEAEQLPVAGVCPATSSTAAPDAAPCGSQLVVEAAGCELSQSAEAPPAAKLLEEPGACIDKAPDAEAAPRQASEDVPSHNTTESAPVVDAPLPCALTDALPAEASPNDPPREGVGEIDQPTQAIQEQPQAPSQEDAPLPTAAEKPLGGPAPLPAFRITRSSAKRLPKLGDPVAPAPPPRPPQQPLQSMAEAEATDSPAPTIDAVKAPEAIGEQTVKNPTPNSLESTDQPEQQASETPDAPAGPPTEAPKPTALAPLRAPPKLKPLNVPASKAPAPAATEVDNAKSACGKTEAENDRGEADDVVAKPPAPASKKGSPEPCGWDSDDDGTSGKKQAADCKAGAASVPDGLANQEGAAPSGWDDDHREEESKKAAAPKGGIALDFDMGVPKKKVPKHLADRLSKRRAPKGSKKDKEKDTDASAGPATDAVKPVQALAPGASPSARSSSTADAESKQPSTAADLLNDALIGDAAIPFRGSSSHTFVANFHCVGCDHQVLRIDNYSWNGEVAALFLRNNFPNVVKLRTQLKVQKGQCAYCCQCSSKSVSSGSDLSDVAMGLRWRLIEA